MSINYLRALCFSLICGAYSHHGICIFGDKNWNCQMQRSGTIRQQHRVKFICVSHESQLQLVVKTLFHILKPSEAIYLC